MLSHLHFILIGLEFDHALEQQQQQQQQQPQLKQLIRNSA